MIVTILNKLIRQLFVAKDHPYPRLCYLDFITAVDYILWSACLMELVKSGADIHLQYDEEKDEIYPFKRFWGINLLERLGSWEKNKTNATH